MKRVLWRPLADTPEREERSRGSGCYGETRWHEPPWRMCRRAAGQPLDVVAGQQVSCGRLHRRPPRFQIGITSIGFLFSNFKEAQLLICLNTGTSPAGFSSEVS